MASSIPNSSSNIEKYYPFPLEIKVRDIFSFKLSKENYFRWRTLMMGLIKSQGLVDFITAAADGKLMEMENSEHREAWQITDALLQSWILGTVNEDLLPNIESLGTVKDMWTALETLLSPPQQTTTVPTPQEITSCSTEVASTTEAGGNEETDDNLSQYEEFLMYITQGKWDRAKEFVKRNPDAARESVTEVGNTALAVTLWLTTENHLAKELLELMSPQDVALPDHSGLTPLHAAAATGNIEMAKLLVQKNRHLPNLAANHQMLPVHVAAMKCHRNMVLYLLDVTDKKHELLLGHDRGSILIICLIWTDQCDIALSLIHNNSQWAPNESMAVLMALSRTKYVFQSGARLNLWQQLIYPYAASKLKEIAYQNSRGDVENPGAFVPFPAYVKRKLQYVFWKLIEILVPQMKYVCKIKWQHSQAHELLKYVCSQVATLSAPGHAFHSCLRTAAELGIVEVVEEILAKPLATTVDVINEKQQNVFQIAILNREENIFNLIYQLPNAFVQTLVSNKDSSNMSCLDMIACLKKEQRVKLKAAGAALQMQRELQWYKAVEKLTMDTQPMGAYKDYSSYRKVFSETHEELRKDGEYWMKATANSCTIVSALIVTIMFAAAITAPGGNNGNNGHPIFSNKIAFSIFGMSDAIALFSATSSLLAFLSILTSRYAEEDFLRALPRRLIVGLSTLFISIITMMTSFGATLYLVFGYKKPWILALIAAPACAPAAQFMSSQFPLLYDMIYSTYGNVFYKHSDRFII